MLKVTNGFGFTDENSMIKMRIRKGRFKVTDDVITILVNNIKSPFFLTFV